MYLEGSQKFVYCLRPINDSHATITDILNTRDQNYTFNQLRDMHITPYDILSWSASIDLAEQYQNYIDNENASFLSNKMFFNCTTPWFGSQCQYSFESNEMLSLLDADHILPIVDHTCYILLECDRGGKFICLDWREICDGRMDCLNNGVDEAQCFDLQINECKDNEFRCHNGLCIPKYYLNSEDHSAECVDQSDIQHALDCPNQGLKFDLFHSKENTCLPGFNKFSCNSGECIEDFAECQNGRNLLLSKSMNVQGSLQYNYWLAMGFVTKFTDSTNERFCEEFFGSPHNLIYLHSCEHLTRFPINPILYSHIRFLYRSEQVLDLNINLAIAPDYICNDEQLCDFLTPTFRYKSYTRQV